MALEVEVISNSFEQPKEGKDDMYLVYMAMREGQTKNKEIAGSLGRSVHEVVNIKKQLSRYFERIRSETQNPTS